MFRRACPEVRDDARALVARVSPQFLKVFQKEIVEPTWWEQKLWHMYDATDYAINLFNCPLVAYSGETDIQKQAADVMAEALAHEGMRMTHIIGPGTAHRYHPQSKIEIDRLIDALASRGRDPYPRKIRFTTWTLAYNRMKWVTVDALNKHWDRARLDAEIADNYTVTVTSANVAAFSLDMGAGGCTLDLTRKPDVVIDGQHVAAQAPMSDRSWTGRFRNVNGRWTAIERLDEAGLEKRHGLQGPIDDAFLDSFIMVRPTGTAMAQVINPHSIVGDGGPLTVTGMPFDCNNWDENGPGIIETPQVAYDTSLAGDVATVLQADD